MKKLNDFGEKIGGAKKDIWAIFHAATDAEQEKIARKTALWPHPNYKKMVASGIPKEVCFWKEQVRKSVSAKPTGNKELYIKFVLDLKSAIEACNSMDDIQVFYQDSITAFLVNVPDTKMWKYTNQQTKAFFDGNVILRYVYHRDRISMDCVNTHFLESSEEAEARRYGIIEITKDNLTVSMRKGIYVNKIRTDDYICSFRSRESIQKLIAENNQAFLAMHDSKNLGVFKTKEEAEAAIETEKSAKNMQKKDSFLPPHLSKIEREGSNYRYFRLTDGNILISRYGLRGGEFGNYTTSKDRLASLNMAYDAFEDLYKALGVSPKDMSLGGDLAIAFGARGRGNAMAHYEPVKNVINMTKYRGAGSLAHEWGHAMDQYIGKIFGVNGFASESLAASTIPDSVRDLVNALQEQNGEKTDFYKGSLQFDRSYKKAGNGYWASNHEMFARAFACYVRDKLNGKTSDYLVGHSECAVNKKCKAIPDGEERKLINEKFDIFFADMIQQGFFTKNEEKEDSKIDNVTEVFFFESSDGQLRFC